MRDFWRRVRHWLRPPQQTESRAPDRKGPLRDRVDHVIILDGTMSSLDAGRETNAGLTYRLLAEIAPRSDLSLYYEPGIQWTSWRQVRDVLEGRGLNPQIERAYGALASRYRPGDRVFLLGYSRGAYAVRSLAGVIDRVGLLRREAATQRNVQAAYRIYRQDRDGAGFRAAHCHADMEIEMIGVWDTVKALGPRLPFLFESVRMRHDFHNHALGPVTRHGYHALALDETRLAYAPVLWERGRHADRCVQMWFRGSHGDVGGQLGGKEAARPLANIPLVWMLEQAEALDLPLPEGWRDRFVCDAGAPSVGTRRGWAMLYLVRRARKVGQGASEALHLTARPGMRTRQ